MIDVLTIGETMLRLSPSGQERLGRARQWDTWVAGSESNVAAALRTLGHTVSWVGRLPSNPLGSRVAADLAGLGVDTSSIIWAGADERLGTFYYEPGSPPRLPVTIYDRAESAASRLTPDHLNADLFTNHRHLHVSGITPALSSQCSATVSQAVEQARHNGMTVSVDVNYRSKLWSTELAAEVLTPLLHDAEVIISSSTDARLLFNIQSSEPSEAARLLRERFDSDVAVLTLGSHGAAAYARDSGSAVVPAFPVESSVERLGSGDAFAGGYLSGFLKGCSVERSLTLGAACAALKRTMSGDMLIATPDEISAVLRLETDAGWR